MESTTDGVRKKRVSAEALLQAIAAISENAVNLADPDEAINTILQILGEAAASDRAYLFVARTDPASGNIVCDNLWEWCKEGITPQVGTDLLIGVPIEAFPMYGSHFLAHRHYQAIVREIQDEMTREALAVQDIKAVLLVPLYSGQDFAGFAGFDDCTEETVWSDLEVGFLSAASMQLVGIFKRSLLEKERKALELATVLSASESGISGIMEWNVATDTIKLSPPILHWLGVAQSVQQLTTQEFGAWLAEEDAPQLLAKTTAFLASSDNFYSCEYRLKNSSGQRRWVVAQHVVVERSPDGKPIRMVGTITDVDEQKKMLVHLRESEAKISSILNATRENYFIFDDALRIVDCHINESSELAVSPDYFLGKKLADVFDARFSTLAEKKLHEAASTNSVLQFEYTLTLQGEVHNFQARLSRLSADTSKILVSVLDVTNQRQMELNLARTQSQLASASTELEKKEHKYQINVGESPLAILVFNGEGLISEYNKAAEWLFPGLSDAGTQKRMEMVFGSAQGCTFQDCIACLSREQRCSCEIEVTGITGRTVSIIFTSAKVADDEYVAFCQDITELQGAMNQLAEYKRRFDAFFNAVDDVIYFYDLETRMMVSPNNSRERLLGCSRSEGQTDEEFWNERIHPDDRETVNASFYALLRDGRGAVNYRVIDFSGNVHWLWDRRWVIKNADGKQVRLEGIISDITPVKLAEEAMKQALAKEKELNAMKSKFISATSHEFRTPLTAIFSSTELLEYYGEQWVAEKRKYHYNKIQRSVRQLQGLLDDVLFISKTDNGRVVALPVTTDLYELTTAMRDQVVAAEKKNNPIHIKNQLFKNLQTVDPKLISQILQNLIGNAVKYSPNGTAVVVELAEDEHSIILKVADQGIGIPEQEQPKIYDRFVRASNADMADGTGLGLSIVKSTVEVLQGTLQLFSRVGIGTTITVTLPKTMQEVTNE